MENGTSDFLAFLNVQVKEIEKHRWIESEKAGHDLGDEAVFDWISKYSASFREWWERNRYCQRQAA